MSSKKDYEAMAGIINCQMDSSRKHTGHIKVLQDQLLSIAGMLCEEFEDDNPRFDEERFMRACGFFYVAVNIGGVTLGGSWGGDFEMARAEVSQAL